MLARLGRSSHTAGARFTRIPTTAQKRNVCRENDVDVPGNKLTISGLQHGSSGEEEAVVEDPAVLGAGRLAL